MSDALAAGLHDLPEAAYHADPAPAPSLSASIARLLLTRSPRHAWQAHPRLGGADQPPEETTDAMDAGSALHKLLLGRGADIAVIDGVRYPAGHPLAGQSVVNWRLKAAREAREEARAAGLIPLLSQTLAKLQGVAEAALHQMRAHPGCADFFAAGRSEQVMLWQEGPAWCRSMVDRMPDDPAAPLFDLKFTEMSAAPQSWERRLERVYALQAAFYMRGAQVLRGERPAEFRFVVIELDPPHAVSVMAPDPSLLALAEEDMLRAVKCWHECLTTGEWPAYPPDIYYVAPSVGMMMDAERRRMEDAAAERHRDNVAFVDRVADGEVNVSWGG